VTRGDRRHDGRVMMMMMMMMKIMDITGEYTRIDSSRTEHRYMYINSTEVSDGIQGSVDCE
jgi:hypothetical protein